MKEVHAPLNFIQQAIDGLENHVGWYTVNPPYPRYGNDLRHIQWLISAMREAIPFTLPTDAKLFDDKLSALRGEELRLPFPTTAIEYFASPPAKTTSADVSVYAPKRVVIATEIDSMIAIFYALEHAGTWRPGIASWVLSRDGWDRPASDIQRIEPYGSNYKPGDVEIAGTFKPFLREMYQQIVASVGETEAMRMVTHDISAEVRAVLELIEALTCKNVKFRPIRAVDPAVNARRVRQGKAPFREYQSVYVDASMRPPVSRAGEPSGRASPEEHLRRQHHRRVGRDKVKMWFPAVIVNPGVGRAARKAYVVKKGGTDET
jgi:hypothetical protein